MSIQKHIKYPRTHHLPWSRPTSDDKKLTDDSQFYGKMVVVTLKMDGENTTMYDDKIHARSIDSANVNHYTRDWVKGEWGRIKHELAGLRICGENLWAEHTIKYDDLESFFYVFSIWEEENNWCLPWKETLQYCELLEFKTVPVIFNQLYDMDKINRAWLPYSDTHEGYVVRLRDGFHYDDFTESVAKYVKPKFHDDLQAKNKHWLYDKIEPNKLKV
jgi:ATP-dependent RNA circularization protein (DNA/RNA ligase family)